MPGQIEALIAGSNYPAISGRDVKAFRIAMPTFEEQTAIATILSDMDNEIAAIEARREKTKAIKQGMIQQLLTGETRLK
jgi:type I restriction enzyme, S subunit